MRRTDRQIHDVAEMEDILRKADACRLALVDDGEPYVVVMNFGYEFCDGLPTLYFHCAKAGHKLDIIRKKPQACFVVDCDHELIGGPSGCDWGMKFRSVVGRGLVEILPDGAERKRGLDLLMAHYAGRSDFAFQDMVLARTEVLRLRAVEVTGKKKG